MGVISGGFFLGRESMGCISGGLYQLNSTQVY